MPKIVVLHSGGMDSSVLLAYKRYLSYEPYALHIYYGQRHGERELAHARVLCQKLEIPYKMVDIASAAELLQSVQTDHSLAVPEGHYTHESMKATVTPNRNMILLSLAAGWAITLDAVGIAYAAHAGDHAIYPDCRPEFVAAMSVVLSRCHFSRLNLYTPFVRKTKADLVRLGSGLQVPFELTYSCYNGRPEHCGRCGTCVERREAFELAGIKDPTTYEETK